MLVATAALILFFILYFEFSRKSPVSVVSAKLFVFTGALGCVYALLGGPFCTVDSLSSEKRQGTLGLLFLTDLHAHDIVLGKLIAASLDLALGLLATFPIMAIPLMMGGVSPSEYVSLVLGTFSLLLVSLTLGIFISALVTSGRVSLGLTILLLALLTFVPLVVGNQIGISASDPLAPCLYLLCPAYTIYLFLDIPMRAPFWRYWLHLFALISFSLSLLVLACLATYRARRVRSRGVRLPLPTSLSRLRTRHRAKRRLRLLDSRPITWLEAIRPFQSRLLAFVTLLSTAFWVARHIWDPSDWPDDSVVVLWPAASYVVICLWIAIDAPRRLSDDKQSGALELLLCTSYRPYEIVADALHALWRRYLPPLAIMLALTVYSIVYFGYNNRGLTPWGEIIVISLIAGIVLPVQIGAFVSVGLYQGLASRTSWRASLMVLWKLVGIPWLLCFGWLFLAQSAAVAPWLFPLMITSLHLLLLGFFAVHARFKLAFEFRRLASTSA
jgi:ABC-type transport system involved in multi-copper enzyme maturation permease subunit